MSGPLHEAPVRIESAVGDGVAPFLLDLLADLGARSEHVLREGPTVLVAGGHRTERPRSSAAADWARSGAQLLTGRPGGPPLQTAGRPATLAVAAAQLFEMLTARLGSRVHLDGAPLLGARAGGLSRGGTTSANGSARLLRASDGWFALNLPRAEDRELVPALIASAVDDAGPWGPVARWARATPLTEVEQRCALVGLAMGAWRPERASSDAPWNIDRLPGAADPSGDRPRVVNLGSLWAAPLAAQLLARAGAQVVDVESAERPDAGRVTYPDLHLGHDRTLLDLRTAGGRHALAELIDGADVVITSSRRRALEQLGATPDRCPGPRVWVEIAGHDHDDDRIGMGDDAAVCGGLVALDDRGPVFAGDAIADPLTGALAAVAAAAALLSPECWHVRLSLCGVAAVSRRYGGS